MDKKKLSSVIIVGSILMLVAGVYSVAPAVWPVHYSGTIHQNGVQVFSNVGLTTNLTSFDGGTFTPGDVKTMTCYILNPWNTSVLLHLTASNWSPSNASSYVGVLFDREGYSLASHISVTAIVTVTVYANATGTGIENFSMDLNFSGS